MTITNTLPRFPLVNQLQSPTLDHAPDENARENCVPSSICAALDYLTGKTYEPDAIKDAVYGQGYTGGQSAAHYIAYAARQGVTLRSVRGSQSQLVTTIRSELQAGHPVLVTMPSQWGTAPADPVHPSGWTHVGVMCGYGPGVLRCMNPWGGFWQDQSESWWAARLCYGEVWPLSGGAMSSDYEPVSGSDWMRDKRTGNTCGAGIYRYAVAHNLPPLIMSERKHPNGRDAWAVFGDPKRNTCQDHLVNWDNSHNRAIEQWMSVPIALAAQVDTLSAQVASLTQQLDDAKAATHPSTPATPAEPSKADELVAAIKAALAAA